MRRTGRVGGTTLQNPRGRRSHAAGSWTMIALHSLLAGCTAALVLLKVEGLLWCRWIVVFSPLLGILILDAAGAIAAALVVLRRRTRCGNR